MAQIFGKSPNTIMRAVAEGRLPKPFRIFSENCWRVGDVDRFLQQRMQDAQKVADEHSQDAQPEPSPSHLKPLKRGASPIRLEPYTGDT
jgi:predicted DNA-binding transcriptional regulator AlpA